MLRLTMPRLRMPATAGLLGLAIAAGTALLAPAPAALAQEGAPAAITGDAKKGARVFNRCKACHTVEKGAPHRIGPNLYGVVGAPIARHADYKYSKSLQALAAERKVWTPENLDAFLKKPRDLAPQTTMSFPGLPRAQDRANVITYLATFSDAQGAGD